MSIFLNPDFIYIALVLGFLLAILSLVAPGTGYLELAAFALLAISGWGVSQNQINGIALAILLIGVIPFLLALRKTHRLLYLILSMIALSIGSTFLFVNEAWHPSVDPILAVVVNVLVVGFFWIVVRKGIDAIQDRPAHSLETLTGAIGETRTPVYREGSVYVEGEMWSATSDTPIPAQHKVKIIRRNGLTLQVTPLDSQAPGSEEIVQEQEADSHPTE